MSWWRHPMETFSALLALCAGIHRSPVNSPHKGQWRGVFMFSLIGAWTNGCANNRSAGITWNKHQCIVKKSGMQILYIWQEFFFWQHHWTTMRVRVGQIMYAIYISISKYLGQPSLHNAYITGTLRNRFGVLPVLLEAWDSHLHNKPFGGQSVMGTFGGVFAGSLVQEYMMTSSNGNIFRVTDPLCGEFAGHQ